MFEIRDDRLHIDGRPCRFVPTEHVGGRIEPTLIVIHDTAGALRPFSSVEWLKRNPSKVSAHFVVEIDGTITQMADCDRKLNHAGDSTWRGRRYCNGFSIGIEIVSPGKLIGRNSTEAVTSFGQVFQLGTLVHHDGPKHGGKGWWLPYDKRQLDAVENLVRALASGYSTIVDVAGHFEVAPGRKVDPGPHFPLELMRDAVRTRAPSISQDEMRKHQRRLVDLGYQVGDIDGHMGPRTRSAIRDFQDQNRLVINGKLDPRTTYALHEDAAKPFPTGNREEAAAHGMAASGSSTVSNAGILKRGSEGGGSLELMASVQKPLEDGQSLLDKLVGAKSFGEQFGSITQWATSPHGIKSLAVLAACGGLWWLAHNIEWARVRDYLKGRHVGG